MPQPAGLRLGIPGGRHRLVAGPLGGIHRLAGGDLGPADPVGGGPQPAAGVLDVTAGECQAFTQLVVLGLGASPHRLELVLQARDRPGRLGRAG